MRRTIGGISVRIAAWLAWSLSLLCVALTAASLILALLNGRTLGESFMAWRGEPSIACFAIVAVSFSVVGTLIASQRPGNPIGWASALPPSSKGSRMHRAVRGLCAPHESWLSPSGSRVVLAGGVESWAPGLGLIVVFLPLLFPDGRPPSRHWRPVGWLGGLSIGLVCVLTAIVLWPERGPALVRPGDFPTEFEGWRYAVEGLVNFAYPMMLLAGTGP